ncbi:MAG: arginine--tRNA ligase [Planctomycetes bacterium]|nr:arginine--tRNA ligase [Planctomycetota bacterium]MCC7170946.1 arginine--tRNA ligase [Planctomycetota bacterium]
MDEHKNKIAELVARTLGCASTQVLAWIETPKDPKLGDYALPCFLLAKERRRSPMAIATELAASLAAPARDAGVEAVRAVGPYVNFTLDRGAFVGSTLTAILGQGDAYGSSDVGAGKTVVVDFSSPNIAKPFGIHHLRSTVIGAAIVRLHRRLGYRVVGINHLGDWGTQFGQLITAWQRHGDEARLDREGIPYLLELYVGFNQELATNPGLRDDARRAFAELERGDPEARRLWKRFRDVSEAEFRRIYDLLGIQFDAFTGESFFEDKMAPVVAELAAKGLLQESRDARIVDLTADGLGICLIQKADDSSLYVTRDLAAAMYRHATYGFTKALYVVGGAQSLHFQQLVRVLELLGRDFAKGVVHVPFGLMRFKDRKMSTRSGDILLLEDVLNQAVARARAIVAEKNPTLANDEGIAKAIGVGAVVFNDLKNRRVRDVVFDWAEVLAFEGETGPYVQYCHARIASVLRKAGGKSDADLARADFTRLATDVERELVRKTAEFGAVLTRAADACEPSFVADYLLELGAVLNRFYIECRILGEEPATSDARLALVRAAQIVLKNGLAVLGLEALEEM